MIDVLTVLEWRIHKDAIVLAVVLQKIAVADDVAVAFGGEDALQREVLFEGRDVGVRLHAADSVENVAFPQLGSSTRCVCSMPARSSICSITRRGVGKKPGSSLPRSSS